MSDDIDADAFHAAHEAAPEINPEKLRVAIDTYMERLHLHVRRVHAERELTTEETLDAFKPRDVTVKF